jgi:DNA invertase Pin-like site-specific DNA recombinase
MAAFESDLIRTRTREGMATAKVREQLMGRRPKRSPGQERHMVALPRAGDHTVAELVELFGVGRTTVYRALERHPAAVQPYSKNEAGEAVLCWPSPRWPKVPTSTATCRSIHPAASVDGC